MGCTDDGDLLLLKLFVGCIFFLNFSDICEFWYFDSG